MKKGKSKGKIRQPKKKAARFKTIYVRDEKDITRFIVPKLEEPDKPPSKLKESGKAMAAAFPHSKGELMDSGQPDLKKKVKVKASVTCISTARDKKEETTPNKVLSIDQPKPIKPLSRRQRKRLESERRRGIRDECATYARWAAGAIKSRDMVELSYYSKLEHRFWMKDMKRQAMDDAQSAVVHTVYGPPKPSTDKMCLPKPTDLSHVRSLGEYSLKAVVAKTKANHAKMKRDVTTCNTQLNRQQLETAARNDPSFAPSVADVQWWINNHMPPDWPDIIKDYTCYLDSGYRPDKEKILGKSGMSLQVQYDELEHDYSVLQMEHWNEKAGLIEKNEALQEQIGLLSQELSFAYEQSRVQGFNEAHLSPQGGKQASDKASPPHVASLALQYNIFKQQFKDDPLKSFLRASGHDFGREKELRNHFDKECVTRCNIGNERRVFKKWAMSDGHLPNREWRQFKVKQWLAARIAKQKRLAYEKPPLPVEINTLQHWGHRKPTCQRRLLSHEVRMWWANALTPEQVEQRWIDIENKQLMSTTSYKVLKGIKDVATFEVNPFERKRKKEAAEHKAKLIAKSKRHARIKAKRDECKAKARASAIKRMAEEQSEADIMRQRIRQAMSTAY